jgi:hypothetical protein
MRISKKIEVTIDFPSNNVALPIINQLCGISAGLREKVETLRVVARDEVRTAPFDKLKTRLRMPFLWPDAITLCKPYLN